MPLRCPAALLVSVIGVVIAACNGSGGVVPVVPLGADPATLDAYDAAVLASTGSVAPTFPEVKEPRDESPRRFRAWLGWHQDACAPCAEDDPSACAPCPGPKPYVCTRPSRVFACEGDDIVARSIEGPADVPNTAGVYVFEGKWGKWSERSEASELVMTSIVPIELPDAGR